LHGRDHHDRLLGRARQFRGPAAAPAAGIVLARGVLIGRSDVADASDVAMVTSFGRPTLQTMTVPAEGDLIPLGFGVAPRTGRPG